MAEQGKEPTTRRAPRALGSLESLLMGVLWEAPSDLSVQEVCDRLGPGHHYKTVMTVLNRLVEKDLLARELNGRAYHYRATHDRDSFLHDAAGELVREYVESYGPGSEAHLAQAVGVTVPRQPVASPGASPLQPAGDDRPSPLVLALIAAVILETVLLLLPRGKSGKR